MSTEKAAQDRARELALKMQAVVEDADLSQADKKSALDSIEPDLKSAQDEVALHRKVNALTGGQFDANGEVHDETAKPTGSIGQQFVESDGYKAIANRIGHGQFSTGSVELDMKTVGTIDEANLAGTLVTPQYLPGIVDLRFQPLVVADLFAQGVTSSNVVSYAKESVFQNMAAGVAESGLKPQSDDSFVRVTETLGKIAHIAKITDEMLSDYPGVQSFLDARMILGVRLKEQDALLNGTGAPTVTGVLQRSGLTSTVVVDGTTIPTDMEGIYHQITAIRTTAFLEPDACVINPVDWQKIRLAKDANNQYFAGGPFTGAYGNGGSTMVDALWGLRCVVTPAIAAGTALVGAFQQSGQVFRKGALTVEATNSNSTDFQYNLVTVRAEERLLLAVYRPAGFGKVTLV